MSGAALLFIMFFILILISATPILGSMNVKGALPFIAGLFGVFFVIGWAMFILLPFFNV